MKKLFAKTLAVVVFVIVAAVQVMAQNGFAYQAVIRDSEGNLVTQGEVGLQFSLMNAGKTYYVEAKKATPNQYGNISVIIGDGKNKVSGSFDDVPWNTLDITLKVEVDVTGGTNYKLLGETKINPVPYALYAAKGGGAATVNSATKDGESLFQVNDRNGNPVFAVTENGIVVYVDPDSYRGESSDKLRRSGFLVTGREATKGEPAKEYFSVTTDGTQIYVDGDDSKLRRSGFLVTGREATKDDPDKYFTVDGTGTKVYVDMDGDDSKLRRSGFLVTGREATKAAPDKLFAIDGGLTTVYIDDSDSYRNDSYLDGDKLRRSGFLVTGRESKASNGIINITGTRTNLTTTTFSIANAGASEVDAPVSALQITGDNITMNSDMAMEGGVRPALEVEQNEEYNIYISDNEDDDPDGFDRIYIYDNFSFDPYEMVNGYYYWLASFHDTLVVPLTSQESILMLNSNGEETAIPQDACVAVFFPDRYSDYINVWPLRKLDNFKVSFALTDYDISYGAILGYADEYARLNVTISSKAAYPGCWLYLGGPQVYTAKVETSQGTFEVETGGNYNKEYRAVLGETVTMAVTKVPDGQVFDSWRCNGRRYTDSVLHLPITQMSTYIYPVFKDISPVLWVDVNAADGGLGTKDEPYNTIAAALGKIIEENDNTLRGFRINVINSENVTNLERDVINIGDSLNDYAKHITIDFVGTGDFARRISGITDLANIPVIVRNAEVYINESNPEEGNALLLSGKRLTLDGCLVHGSDGYQKKRGLYVEKGELVMIGGTVNNCRSENGNGGGAYVADGAILTLKNEAALENNTAQKGFGVYLCGGATLNVSNSYTNGNVKKDGDDVYAAGECNFIVSGWSEIGKVGLGNGAYVTRNIEGNDELNTIEFSTIGDPKNQVAKVVGTLPYWMQEDMMDSETFFSEMFKITDQNRLDEGYSSHLKFDGNIGYPFITKKIFSKGMISLKCPDQIDVYYTYYRGEDDEEYLRLKYQFGESDYECHNYWLIGDNVYCDTIYASNGYAQGFAIGSGADLNEYYSDDFSWPAGWDDYGFARTDDFKNLLTVNTAGLSLDDDGNIIDNENKIIAFLNKGIIASCTSRNLFKDILPGFKSLIQRSLCIEGKGESINVPEGVEILQWTQGGTYFGDDVNYENEEIETEDVDFPINNYSLEEIEEHFNKLRNGFDVTILALGGTVTDGDGKKYSGITHLENVAYNTPLTLTAQQGENEFIGWSDGVSEGTSTRTFIIRGDVEIMPIFKQSEFTVSADGVYKSINMVGKYLENSLYTSDDNVIIKVKGTVKGPQTLSDKINVGSITIDGADGANPNGVLDARRRGRVLTINTTSPVIIKNLTITGGRAESDISVYYYYDDENGYGGGIMMTEGTNVTLDDGTIVGKTGVTNVPDNNKYANFATIRGGGIYNDGGTLTLKRGSMVSYNYADPCHDGYFQTFKGGGGIYCRCGVVNIEDGASVTYNYSKSRGGGVHLENDAQLTSSGNIDNNVAFLCGGGVFFSSESENDLSSTFTMEGGSVSNNKATYESNPGWWSSGGGIFIDGGGTVTIKGNSVISNNEAPYKGGAIKIARGTLDLQGGSIVGNKLMRSEEICHGGAIDIEANCTFKISGNVSIPCTGVMKNDIFLDSGDVITIAGKLTPPDEANGIVATITPETYAVSAQVLKYELADGQTGTTLADERGKFAVMPDEENNNYTVGYDGELMTLYKISNAEQLENLFSRMNEQEISTENIYISIENNLELTNHVPFEVEVRINENDWKTVGFKGVFDGNGHTITIESFDKSKTWGNSKKNVNTLVCYENEGIIQNVIVKGEIENKLEFLTGHVDAGGLCYCNAGGIVRNCWNDMSFDVSILHQTGGICAINKGLIENCINTGTIKAEFNDSNWENVYGLAGGICGENMSSDPGVHAEGVIKNCVNYGQVEISTTNNYALALNGIGGAICASNGQESSKQGATYPTIEYCYWLENCVKTGKAGTGLETTNYMVYNDSRVRFGTASHCNYIDSRDDGIAVRPGSVELCGNEQNYEDGPKLDENLNTYVDNTNNGVLKHWVKIQEGSNYIVVLNFND